MGDVSWGVAAPAIGSAFAASFVEFVEAFTIILAVATLRGWRPAVAGTLAALAVLTLLVVILGPLLERAPVNVLQIVIGVLLLLFGMGWLRKAILRAVGVIALHDENAAFAGEIAELAEEAKRHQSSLSWIAGIAAFKAVLLEGLEVIFIVIAVGAGRDLLGAASLGAAAAGIVVLTIGAVVHRPLAAIPENTLKFGVGVILSAFGVFWTGEGLGVEWPGADLVLLLFSALFLATGLVCVNLLRRTRPVPLP